MSHPTTRAELRLYQGEPRMKSKLFGVVCVVAASSALTPAYAADLGGDCCADLEERVAELEATTARKGNRKVSLTVYGQVNTAVMFWDAPNERNVYVVDNDISSTRFGFKGKAKISSDWSAGYKIEVETQSAASNEVDEGDDDGPPQILLRKSEWYVKSKTLGTFTVGQGGFASDDAATVDLSGTNIIAQFDDLKFGERFDPRPGFAGAGRGDYDDYTRGGSWEFNRGNRIRYDTPTIAGFTVSAAWGEDDAWDVALRYAGEFGQFKMAGAVAYGEVTDRTGSLSNDNVCNGDCDQISLVTGSASIMHSPTGLFVTAAAAWREFDNVPGVADEENNYFAIRGGISQKWIPLGKTAIYGEWQTTDIDNFRGDLGRSAGIDIWGAGIVQKIDAAAMEMYLGYRHASPDDDVQLNLGDLNVVTAGARIKF